MGRLKFALWGMLFATPAVFAEQTYDLGNIAQLSVNGFFKEEIYRNTNQSAGLTNCGYTNDPRGVFGTFCQPGVSRTASPKPLALGELSAGLSHEFDSAWKLDSRLSYRVRNGNPDIVGQSMIEANVAASHPVYGEVRGGTMLSRSWSRSDSFSYPLGMSSAWSESGVGYSLFKRALRYDAPMIDFDGGKKLQLEITSATNDIRYAQSAPTVAYDQAPPRPRLWEFFAQYADNSNLVEYIYQSSRGGQQSSWGKGPFVGDVGNADGLGITPALGAYTIPTEDVHILQGDHYFNPNWKATFGVRRNSWSGTAYQCDYVSSTGCYFPAGFNNGAPGTAANVAHAAWSVDFMGGVSNFQGPWTYTAGFVRLNKAYTSTPVEYGQSNTATYINLGVNRKMPEVYKNLTVYSGLGYVRFGSLGPAPMSMPSELAFFGVDPRTQSSALLFTVGAGITF